MTESRTEIISFLKMKHFINVTQLNKNRLVTLRDNFMNDGVIPDAHTRKKKIGENCSQNDNCRSKICVRNKCQKKTHTTNAPSKNFKPLPTKTILSLTSSDKIRNQCTELKNVQIKTHQRRIAQFMQSTKRKGLLILHNVGSGKTITSLVTAKCILARYPTKSVVILTPTSVKLQFEQELNRLEFSPEMFSRFEIYTHNTWLDRYAQGMYSLKNKILIVDEAHRFNSIIKMKPDGTIKSGIYSIHLINAAFDSFKTILLTATPIQNYVSEMVNYLFIIKNMKYSPKKYIDLVNEFKVNKNTTVLKDFSPSLKCLSSFFRNENNKHFPTVKTYNTPLFMNKKYYDTYMQVEYRLLSSDVKKLFLKNHEEPDRLKHYYNGIRRAINNVDIESSPKFTWIINKIISSKHEKCLVYSNWLEFGVKFLENELTKHNIRSVTIEGSISATRRKTILQEYNDGKVTVLFITSAGAEGLDLKNTTNVIITEPFWHESRINQVIGRAVRYKSHDSLPAEQQVVNVYHLILKKPNNVSDPIPSADEILFNISQKKTTIISQFIHQIEQSSIEYIDCK